MLIDFSISPLTIFFYKEDSDIGEYRFFGKKMSFFVWRAINGELKTAVYRDLDYSQMIRSHSRSPMWKEVKISQVPIEYRSKIGKEIKECS